MTPEELDIIDSALKIGLGGLIGILTSIVGGMFAYKTALASSRSSIYENTNNTLKESILHINHYHSNLSQFLYCIEHANRLAQSENDRSDDLKKEQDKITKFGNELFEV